MLCASIDQGVKISFKSFEMAAVYWETIKDFCSSKVIMIVEIFRGL